MKHKVLLIALLLFPCHIFAHDSIPEKSSKKEYSFIIRDSPASLFTMRQFDENYLSAYRLAINELNNIVSPKASVWIQTAATTLFLIPLTHEEGHRSILTGEKIGSISKPYFNKRMAAYVTGVTDAQLIELRDSKLPNYIRLYTSGLESDYALLLRENSLLNWKEETKEILRVEYINRKVSYISYYAMGLVDNIYAKRGVSTMSIFNLKEETNELDRDIVGHDVYGAIRHLHRPDMEFYRYTDYLDLTSEEQQFAQRVGWRSLLNFVDPLLFGKTGFTISNKYRFNLSLGYGMCPFGDYIDEHFWLSTGSFKSHLYFRQFQNKNNWFPAFGINIPNISISDSFLTSVSLHGWQQPQELSFTQNKGELGGGQVFG